MSVAVDSNILFDIAGATEYADAVQQTIEEALDARQLVVCPVVQAELVTRFPDQQALILFLSDIDIELQQFSQEALWNAGKAWVTYSIQAEGLITRGQGYYRTYFPELKLMVPGRR